MPLIKYCISTGWLFTLTMLLFAILTKRIYDYIFRKLLDATHVFDC